MGGRMSRNKGKRVEYEIRDMFTNWGYESHRVPLSGSSQGFKGDIRVRTPDAKEYTVEVKARKDAFKTIYRLLAGDVATRIICATHSVILTSDDPILWQVGPVQALRVSPALGKQLDTLYKLKGDADILALKRDRDIPLFLVWVR